jgi:iron complex transport system permease protein
LAILSIAFGAVNIPIATTLNTLFDLTGPQSKFIILESRLPRVIIGLLAGASLGAAGAIIQAVIRNPLASPKILGINAGAGFFAFSMILFFPSISSTYLPFAAIVGGLSAAFIIYGIYHFKNYSTQSIVLVGIAISFIFEAGIDYLINTSDNHEYTIPLIWLTGSLWGRSWIHVNSVAPFLIVLLGISYLFVYKLDLITLGDPTATGLGIRVESTRFILLVLATLLTSISVGVVGVMGFVGLMSPHIARAIIGGGHRYIIPTAALIGMLLITLADLIGRLISPPLEISAGILTACFGAPFFVYLMIKSEKD